MSNLVNKILNPDKVLALQLFQLFRYGSIILINVLLAKSYLDISDIGIYETLIFLGTGITFFWVSGLLKGMLAIYPGLSGEKRQVFFFNVFLLFAGMSILMASFYYLCQPLVLRLLTDYSALPFFNLLCIYILLNTSTYLVEYIYLLTDQPKKIVWFGILAFSAQLLAVTVPIFLGFGLEMSFYCLIAMALLKLLWLLFVLSVYSKLSIDFELLRPYLLISLPLVANIFVVGGAEYVDGILIHRYFDKEAFAVFRYGARELPLSLALAGAFSSALIPTIADNLADGLEQIKSKSRQLIHLLYGVSIVLMLVSPVLFPIVFRPEFTKSALIFNIYLLILISRVLFPQTILIGKQQTRVILWISIAELIINVLLSILFIYYFGLAGVAFATVIACLFDKVALAVYLRSRFEIGIQQYLDVKLYALYSLALIAAFAISLTYL